MVGELYLLECRLLKSKVFYMVIIQNSILVKSGKVVFPVVESEFDFWPILIFAQKRLILNIHN